MDLDLSPEQKAIQAAARELAQAELEPVAGLLDREFDRRTFVGNLGKLAAQGFMGMNVRRRYGGAEAGTVALSLVLTELGRACAATAASVSVTNMVAEVIQAVGSEEQKATYLPRISSGEYPAASFALTEAGAGSDPAGMVTQAVADGDAFVLDGEKRFITNAPYAGVFVVWAVTDRAAPKGKGISCFLVEAGTRGLVVGRQEDKMGQRASATNEVRLERCRVPRGALLGRLNDGFRVAVAELAGGRIGVGSLALGIGLAAMDYATRYASERVQFGEPVTTFEGVQWMLADAYTELEAARLLLASAAFQKERGRPYAKAASMAKLFATEAAERACRSAVQLMGGQGYLRDHPVERYARDVRVTSIYEGTNEIQRLIVAREILKELVRP
ncbi:acyl-CoA dehydrogenase family protein [Anaeromyxobacter paludicola]|uniref:Butyryl-CoA dehydrogenase n=1 Tax=Anaeromyxobacter paludicola TaxID=2918171 RepID=A0ABM7XDZ8_9BACT|nr:acyl-CoA dehydrogenase family protein [Anaeromyxobacter paludicola]BDG10109.1 butyryl-CoA dehydrogenase [Anaeromyxobacter paludicola]